MLRQWIPRDMFAIQTAFEKYEKTFPDRPSLSHAAALAWYANQRGIEWRPTVRSRITACARGLWSRAFAPIRLWWHKIVLPFL